MKTKRSVYHSSSRKFVSGARPLTQVEPSLRACANKQCTSHRTQGCAPVTLCNYVCNTMSELMLHVLTAMTVWVGVLGSWNNSGKEAEMQTKYLLG